MLLVPGLASPGSACERFHHGDVDDRSLVTHMERITCHRSPFLYHSSNIYMDESLLTSTPQNMSKNKTKRINLLVWTKKTKRINLLVINVSFVIYIKSLTFCCFK